MFFEKLLFGAVLSLISSVVLSQSAGPYSAESAIYRVEVPHKNTGKMSLGTGVLIASDKILTNCHVVKGPEDRRFPRVIHRQTEQTFAVSSYYNLGNLDACVLQGRFIGNPVRIAQAFIENENVWIYGYPQGESVIGRGSVDRLVDTDKGKSILLAAFCSGGSSGGPVINVKGELVGLNFGSFRYQDRCLAIPASSLRPHLSGI